MRKKVMYKIYSFEHKGWWQANNRGYTKDVNSAGLYKQTQAVRICMNANIHNINEMMMPVEVK